MEAHTHRLWQHRFSRIGPYKERWQGLFVPLTAETGLADVHCTWNGVFVAEAIAALRPAWHLLLSDTDVAPTALFEVGELVQLCEQICHNSLQAGQPGLIVGTEPHQDINAGLAIFPGTARLPTAKGYDCTCWSGLGFPYHSSRLRPHPPTLSTRSSCKPLPLPSCMQSMSNWQPSLAHHLLPNSQGPTPRARPTLFLCPLFGSVWAGALPRGLVLLRFFPCGSAMACYPAPCPLIPVLPDAGVSISTPAARLWAAVCVVLCRAATSRMSPSQGTELARPWCECFWIAERCWHLVCLVSPLSHYTFAPAL